ncbi:twin-arginine translocation signal domain-containing protein [Streptacidiphilus sp. PAMC 29251]
MAEQSSRRTFLQHASLSTAALGATVLIPSSVAHAASAKHAAPRNAVGAVSHEGPLMAYVKNAHTGEIAVMVGEREVLHRDPQLAAALSRVAASGA